MLEGHKRNSFQIQQKYAANLSVSVYKIKFNTNTTFYRVQCTVFYIENDAEIFSAHYTQKVAEKGFLDGFYNE